MAKNILMLVLIATLCSNCSKNDEIQNLDVRVTGKVTDQNNIGVENVTVHVKRGTSGAFYGSIYDQYETVVTNSSGNYRYIVKNDKYYYQICCGIPPDYSIVGEGCKTVDARVVNGHTVPNIINFKLTQ